MSTAPTLRPDGSPRQKHGTAWRFANDGIQLYTSLWWVAYVAPSSEKPGQWWWKTTAVGEDAATASPSGYAATPEEALTRVRESLALCRLYEYRIPDDAEAMRFVEMLKARQPKQPTL